MYSIPPSFSSLDNDQTASAKCDIRGFRYHSGLGQGLINQTTSGLCHTNTTATSASSTTASVNSSGTNLGLGGQFCGL